ncbi:MAG: hypothetical protein AAGF92_01815 [Myxococcota bacterium]
MTPATRSAQGRPARRTGPTVRWAALFACLVWFGGVEVFPAIHVAFHGAFGEHHHGPRAHHQDASPRERAHEYDKHDGHPHDDVVDVHEDRGPNEHPSDHGEGSLAHHDLAIEHSYPDVPPVPEALLRSEPIAERVVRSLVSSAPRRTHWARGPPESVGLNTL